MAEMSPADLAVLANMLQAGTVKPVIDRSSIGSIKSRLPSATAWGKVVVTID